MKIVNVTINKQKNNNLFFFVYSDIHYFHCILIGLIGGICHLLSYNIATMRHAVNSNLPSDKKKNNGIM